MKTNVHHHENKHHHKLAITATTVAGAGAGALYARNHLSESKTKQLIELDARSPKWLTELVKTFSKKAAEAQLKNGNITQEEYDKFTTAHSSIVNTIKAENTVNKIIKTPIEQRTVSYNEASKTARNAHFKLHKDLMKINNELFDKFSNLSIINKENFQTCLKDQAAKVKESFKIIAKPMLKGFAIGGVIGGMFGLGLTKFFDGGKKHH